MKAKPLAQELLDELTGFDQSILLSEFKRHRYLFECDKAIRVNPAEGYMCKAIVHSLSNDFDQMYQNFQIAMRLAPNDKLIKMNFIASLANYGRFEEASNLIDINALNQESIEIDAFYRVLFSTLDLGTIRKIDSDYADQIENMLAEIEVEISDAKKYITLFNNVMSQKKIRFGLIPAASWKLDEDLFVYYDFVGTAEQSIEFMDEFDNLVADLDLKHVARKITIVLLPIGSC